MKSEPNKLAQGLRAGQTLYLVTAAGARLGGFSRYFVRAIRVLSDKAPPPRLGEVVEAAPRRWLAARLSQAAIYKSRREAERYRKAFQAAADRKFGRGDDDEQ